MVLGDVLRLVVRRSNVFRVAIKVRRLPADADPEGWQLRFADLAEVAAYCPGCAEREFGLSET